MGCGATKSALQAKEYIRFLEVLFFDLIIKGLSSVPYFGVSKNLF
jgi:hypothetical protein